MAKAKKGEVLQITDEQIGCPIKTVNLAKYLLKHILTENQEYGIYHFTDAQVMSWYGFAQNILKENGLNNTTIIVKDNNYRSFAKRPQNSILN